MLETISNLLRESPNLKKGADVIMSNIFQISESGELMKIFGWFFQQHAEEIDGADSKLSFINHFNATRIPNYSQYE